MTHWRDRTPTDSEIRTYRITWLGLTVALLLASAGLMLWVCAARADEGCPTDKPFARTVTEYPASMQCTLLACPPRLVCGEQVCSLLPTNDCNRCYPEPTMRRICLSQEELDRAK